MFARRDIKVKARKVARPLVIGKEVRGTRLFSEQKLFGAVFNASRYSLL